MNQLQCVYMYMYTLRIIPNENTICVCICKSKIEIELNRNNKHMKYISTIIVRIDINVHYCLWVRLLGRKRGVFECLQI